MSQQVLAEIKAGDGLTLAAAGRMLPGHRGNKNVDPSTVFRWIVKGIRTFDGSVVKLEAVRIGGRWLTSPAAIDRFSAALTSSTDSTEPPASIQASSRSAILAGKALAQMGS